MEFICKLIALNVLRYEDNLVAIPSFMLHTLLWTDIFHVRPHSIDKIRFYLVEKFIFGKFGVTTYFILFYFKRENKTRKKTLKKWLHIFFGKTCLWKTLI